MGYHMDQKAFDQCLLKLSKEYTIYAPKRFDGKGAFSDTDLIRYGEVKTVEEIEFNEKSRFSFKEILLPITQTLFYFTENEIKEADSEQRGAIVFLRSCDLHAVKRLDEIYLRNGFEDVYYKRIREKVKFILIGCSESFDSCFCVDMGTNRSKEYSAGVDKKGEDYYLDVKEEEWKELFSLNATKEQDVTISYVTETKTTVHIPENLSFAVAKSTMWDEYDSRCIACGRCNFSCPTCTCFTMQDLFYTDNGKVGERRRVHASCMVDGFTGVAGGGQYRKKNGERMRFKVLHKVLDFKQRNGYHMCVGCGRCDDVCPEYISFSNCLNHLEEGMKEVSDHE